MQLVSQGMRSAEGISATVGMKDLNLLDKTAEQIETPASQPQHNGSVIK